ncbi:MAG: glycosyltransferase family 4 protein [Candidatus Nanoarchaeia archaeon]
MCSDYYECFHISQNLSRLQKIAYGWLVRLMLWVACRGSLVIALSRHLEKVAKRHGATKIKIVPIYGIDMNIFKPKAQKIYFGTDKKIVLTTARLCPEKGLKYALEAVSKIEDVFLVIAGLGDKKEAEELIVQLKIENRVKLVGEVDPVSIADYYNSCDVFVMPSLTEGLGFSSGEAMACKKPVIASNVGGIPDLVIDGKTGILVPPADSDALCDAIKRVLGSKALAKKLGEKGYEHVKKNFEEKVVTEKFVSAIHEYYKKG